MTRIRSVASCTPVCANTDSMGSSMRGPVVRSSSSRQSMVRGKVRQGSGQDHTNILILILHSRYGHVQRSIGDKFIVVSLKTLIEGFHDVQADGSQLIQSFRERIQRCHRAIRLNSQVDLVLGWMWDGVCAELDSGAEQEGGRGRGWGGGDREISVKGDQHTERHE